MAFKIWKFWNKAGFLNYRSGSETFCTVTCYFLWDAKQTGGIIISSFSCCWGFSAVELLSFWKLVVFSSLPSVAMTYCLVAGQQVRGRVTSQTLSLLQAHLSRALVLAFLQENQSWKQGGCRQQNVRMRISSFGCTVSCIVTQLAMQIISSLIFENITFCNKVPLLSLSKRAGRWEREGGMIHTEDFSLMAWFT